MTVARPGCSGVVGIWCKDSKGSTKLHETNLSSLTQKEIRVAVEVAVDHTIDHKNVND